MCAESNWFFSTTPFHRQVKICINTNKIDFSVSWEPYSPEISMSFEMMVEKSVSKSQWNHPHTPVLYSTFEGLPTTGTCWEGLEMKLRFWKLQECHMAKLGWTNGCSRMWQALLSSPVLYDCLTRAYPSWGEWNAGGAPPVEKSLHHLLPLTWPMVEPHLTWVRIWLVVHTCQMCLYVKHSSSWLVHLLWPCL